MIELELTDDEENRLKTLLISSKIRSSRQNWKRKPGIEQKIIEMLNDGISTNQICKVLKVSSMTVINVRKDNGLWGA